MENNIAIEKRRQRRPLLGSILLLLLLGGWFYPPLGYFMIVCMVMAMGIGMIKGRYWCAWMCPRGSFFDTFLGRFSRNVKAPSLFRSPPFRLLWLGILMGMLAVNLVPLWPDFYLMGKPFVMILSVTTAVGLVLGMLYQPRVWCMFCPMGTMANWLGRGKELLAVNEDCVECGICENVCRMQINPGSYRETGLVTNSDCLKCSYCVEKCPKHALSFSEMDQK